MGLSRFSETNIPESEPESQLTDTSATVHLCQV